MTKNHYRAAVRKAYEHATDSSMDDIENANEFIEDCEKDGMTAAQTAASIVAAIKAADEVEADRPTKTTSKKGGSK